VSLHTHGRDGGSLPGLLSTAAGLHTRARARAATAASLLHHRAQPVIRYPDDADHASAVSRGRSLSQGLAEELVLLARLAGRPKPAASHAETFNLVVHAAPYRRRTASSSTRHIGDFTHWKDHDTRQKALDRLLRDLRIEKT
jgi:hypothetical protein